MEDAKEAREKAKLQHEEAIQNCFIDKRADAAEQAYNAIMSEINEKKTNKLQSDEAGFPSFGQIEES